MAWGVKTLKKTAAVEHETNRAEWQDKDMGLIRVEEMENRLVDNDERLAKDTARFAALKCRQTTALAVRTDYTVRLAIGERSNTRQRFHGLRAGP